MHEPKRISTCSIILPRPMRFLCRGAAARIIVGVVGLLVIGPNGLIELLLSGRISLADQYLRLRFRRQRNRLAE